MGIKRVSAKNPKGQADRLWSKCVLTRDKVCIRCQKNPARHPHHIFSRRYAGTRHVLSNGAGLCGGCHREAHTDAVRFHEFIKSKLGESVYNMLKAWAYLPSKHDYKMNVITLQAWLASFEIANEAP